jgi:hypothetical protein
MWITALVGGQPWRDAADMGVCQSSDGNTSAEIREQHAGIYEISLVARDVCKVVVASWGCFLVTASTR